MTRLESYRSPRELFTHSELTEKNYTIYNAFQLAKWRLRDAPVNTTILNNRPFSEKISLYEVNVLADHMETETRYWT